ncbi:MAG: ribosome silencing factor [Spirochaetales bacterium]|nr:ribosome silencing factor [Spirochaetales bacterium]MBQ2259637.1 ribosome silencing factor [Spirochaetales bacterium]
MNEDIKLKVEKIKTYLEDHKCADVAVVDMQDCSWTDAFVIGTVSSVGHLKGVVHQLWGELIDLGLTVNNRHKTPGDDGWELIDCGDVVIHLMSSELREFYNLEKLWNITESSR